jgi:hypothetical protein
MQYVQMSSNGNYPFPDNSIDPKLKDSKWCMQYAKAAYYTFNFVYPKGVFAGNGGDYQKYRLYALGKQPITQYKKWSGIDTVTNNTWMSIDWSIRSIISGYRDKVISRLMKEDYSIVATAIDAEAKGEIDAIYNQLKAKLIVRQQMVQQNPNLASHPLITLQSGEPLDMEELEMRVALGEQFNRSKDAELAIELGFYENDYDTFRKAIFEDLFDFGVAGYAEWLGDDNKAKFRRCNPENVIISYCKDGTFSDMVHAGEEIDVSLIQFAALTDDQGNALFSEVELQEFAGSIAGKFGNPTMLGLGNNKWLKPIDMFKCKVLDIKFYTYDDSSYRSAPDENGNNDFRKAEFGRGKKSEKYSRKRIQYVYQCKWIVGTDKCYDWGMCYDQKRANDPKKKALTRLPYKFIATNFYEMKAQSTMEKLVPYGDDYQLTCLKIQNFKNRAIPSGWWIDLDALENIALNKGGKAMEPKAVLQMLFETGIMLGRSINPAGNPLGQNWKPMIPIENSIQAELEGFIDDMQNTIQIIEKILGFNDITSGNPNPKTLVPGYEIANQDTSDALYPIAFAEETLCEELAADVLCRMKQGIKKGNITGFAPYKNALGLNTLRFIQIDGDLSNRDFGIELQKKSTEQEKAWILQQVNQDIANGLLDTSDAIMIIETHNAKQAMMIIAYKVKKAKQAQQQNQMQLSAQQGQQNQQAAQITAQSQQQMLQQEQQFKLQIAQMQMQTEIQKAQIMAQSQERIAAQTNMVKQSVGETTANAKVTAQAMSSTSEIHKAHITGLHQQAKQQLVNDAPDPSTE